MHTALAALIAIASVFATTATSCPMGAWSCAGMRAPGAHDCCGGQTALSTPSCCGQHARVPELVGDQGRAAAKMITPVVVVVAELRPADLGTPTAAFRPASLALVRIHAPPDSLVGQHTSLLI